MFRNSRNILAHALFNGFVRNLRTNSKALSSTFRLRLEGTSQPIGVSGYELAKLLPDDLKGSLPPIAEIGSAGSQSLCRCSLIELLGLAERL